MATFAWQKAESTNACSRRLSHDGARGSRAPRGPHVEGLRALFVGRRRQRPLRRARGGLRAPRQRARVVSAARRARGWGARGWTLHAHGLRALRVEGHGGRAYVRAHLVVRAPERDPRHVRIGRPFPRTHAPGRVLLADRVGPRVTGTRPSRACTERTRPRRSGRCRNANRSCTRSGS
jgi:hypothetical protein